MANGHAGAMAGTRPTADRAPIDLTVIAVPFYFVSMAAEYLYLRRRATTQGATAGDFERRDTVASLTMGVASLIAPLVLPKLLRPFTPGRGRYGKVLLTTAATAAVVTTVADIVARRGSAAAVDATPPAPGPILADGDTPPAVSVNGSGLRPTVVARDGASGPHGGRIQGQARRVGAMGAVTTVVAGGLAVTTTWAARTTPERLWRFRFLPDAGTGPVAAALAIAGWDFIYYWNHRFMHESRYMWAVHEVHHSSEHYNLSTALRQPVADVLGTSLPYGVLCLIGIPPRLISMARGVNLLYQFWIHTETIGRIGPAEAVLNTPSHHRVHHGSNSQYIDRNHGSILIVWDRVFGTFEPEDARVVYGLTTNINTFNLGRIVSHEYADMLHDVARSTTWSERLSYVLRGPGWAMRRRAEMHRAETNAESETAQRWSGVISA